MKLFNLISIAFLLGTAPLLEVLDLGPSQLHNVFSTENSKIIENEEVKEKSVFVERTSQLQVAPSKILTMN